MSKHSGEKEQRENLLFKKFKVHVSHYQELVSCVWPANTQFQKVSKSGFFQTQRNNPRTSFLFYISFVFPLCLEHLEINEELSLTSLRSMAVLLE